MVDRIGPLETLATTLGRLAPLEGVKAGTSTESFREYVRKVILGAPAALNEREIGHWDDLAAAYANSHLASKLMTELAGEIEKRGGAVQDRAGAAGVNVITGCNMICSAITLYTTILPWDDRSAMVLVRTALECAGRAAFIANGTGSEVNTWEANDQVGRKKWLPPLQSEITKVGGPGDVDHFYHWLCAFTHMRHEGVKHFFDGPETKYSDAYAAIAYTAWILAVVSQKVAGMTGGAVCPRLPDPSPWA